MSADPTTYRDGHAYVAAGPGTGKTRLLVARYAALRAAGVAAERILVLTFSRRAVQELRERLSAAANGGDDAEVRTFHGFAARVAGGGQARFRDGRLLDGFSRALLVEHAIATAPTATLSDAARGSEAFRAEVGRLLDDLSRVPAFDVDGASPRLRDVLAILERLRRGRSAVGGVDLGDLVGRAVHELRRPGSSADAWLTARPYAHVLVDEFQDTDRAQLDLLALLVDRGALLFAVGDDAQSIYRFRGAGHGIVDDAVARFMMRRFTLALSHRCSEAVCALANDTPIPHLMPLAPARAGGAPVDVVALRRPDDEAVCIADAVEAAIADGTPEREIAILLRSFRPLGPLVAAELRRRAIPVASTGREELLRDARVAALRSALEVLHAPHDAARWLRLLTAPPLRFDAVALRLARRALDGLALDAHLPARLETLCRGGGAIGEALLFARAAWNAGDLALAARRLVRRLGLLAAVLHDELPSVVRDAGGRLRHVCDALGDAQRTAERLGIDGSCGGLVERFDDLLPALALDDAGLDPAAPGVRLLTVHAAKGLEFLRVFVADAVNGRFPHDPRPTTLLDDRDRAWLREVGADGASVNGGEELEEACLWYVAVTRAKERLTITCALEGLNGEAQSPSRFVPPALRPEAPREVDREPLLLRAVRSGDQALRDRVVASGALNEMPALRAYAGLGADAFAPTAPRPLQRDGDFRVGDVDRWLTCPRKVYYERFAGLQEEPSETMALGDLLHAVLQRFHEKRTAFDAASIDVEGWAAELLALRRVTWDDKRFGGAAVAIVAAEAADAALRGYARALADDARALAFTVDRRESNVLVPIGSHRLRGRIDRVDRRDDGARIVDYKSGAGKARPLRKAIASTMKSAEPLGGRAPSDLVAQIALYAAAYERVAEVAYVYLGGVKEAAKRDGAVTDALPYDDAARRFVDRLSAELCETFLDPLRAATLLTLPVAASEKQCEYCAYAALCPGPGDGD